MGEPDTRAVGEDSRSGIAASVLDGVVSEPPADADHPLDDRTAPRTSSGRRRRTAGVAPVAIEVRGVDKRFRIPDHRMDTLKERFAHPLARTSFRELRALQDVSFDVHRGEFFGIVGRNGSGKSTLLKVLASIYRADAGRVRIAGRVSPFIELGVGFNPEMTARENVALNGVLFGLTRREAGRMLDAVLDFAELHEFAELKIKNYSSGMMVRLAFAIMVQADADVMLIDEVLAVGDAAFAQKCMEVFYARRAAGRTIVLVTHDMATVQALCHRALLLHDGVVRYEGEPERAAMNYYRLNFARSDANESQPGEAAAEPSSPARLVSLLHARVLDAAGATTTSIEEKTPIVLEAAVEAAVDLAEPVFVFYLRNAEGVIVSAFEHKLDEPLGPGQAVRFAGELENRLVPGTYALELWIRERRRGEALAVQPIRLAPFVVYGTAARDGVVALRADIDATVGRVGDPTPPLPSGPVGARRRRR
ncbi:MAG: ABC transporter ATP-binding protein [Solirubrobacteraceae bacterium]